MSIALICSFDKENGTKCMRQLKKWTKNERDGTKGGLKKKKKNLQKRRMAPKVG